jgi:predicted Rossmann-fold nucleotide-binding protein
MVSEAGMDVITGGGPGLMNAASEGHHAGRKSNEAHSIGLRIKLPAEQEEAIHLDIKKEFHYFSNRLDTFMRLSNAVVIASGGVGTLLELFYTWQLMQIEQICNIPIILLGDMWLDLVYWIKKWPLKNRLLDIEDVKLLFLAKNIQEAFIIIREAYEKYREGDKKFCLNYRKYQI